MMVCVRLFARARELAGADSISLDLPTGATVGDLRRRLADCRPALAPILERSALAVDGEIAGDSAVVPALGEIAVLPPVSGG